MNKVILVAPLPGCVLCEALHVLSESMQMFEKGMCPLTDEETEAQGS